MNTSTYNPPAPAGAGSSRQLTAFGASLGIHGFLVGILLLLGMITPKTKAIVLDFNLGSSDETGRRQPAAVRRPAPIVREQKTVTPLVKHEQAMPIKHETKEEVPAPVEQQPVAGAAEASPAGGATHAGDSGARYVAAQFVHIRDKIFSNLTYPPIARKMGWAGKVIVAFTVCVDGSVEQIAVLESSGHGPLDKSAVDAVRKSCPLPRPSEKTALVMPVVYRLE